jgi:hypothetical protein
MRPREIDALILNAVAVNVGRSRSSVAAEMKARDRVRPAETFVQPARRGASNMQRKRRERKEQGSKKRARGHSAPSGRELQNGGGVLSLSQ